MWNLYTINYCLASAGVLIQSSCAITLPVTTPGGENIKRV